MKVKIRWWTRIWIECRATVADKPKATNLKTNVLGPTNPRRSHTRWFTGRVCELAGGSRPKLWLAWGLGNPRRSPKWGRRYICNVGPPQAEKKKWDVHLPSFNTNSLADASLSTMNFLSNIDPALLGCSTTPNLPTNQLISQDGSPCDGNSMPAGEPVYYCSASLFSRSLSLSHSGRSVLPSHAQRMPMQVAPVNL